MFTILSPVGAVGREGAFGRPLVGRELVNVAERERAFVFGDGTLEALSACSGDATGALVNGKTFELEIALS